MGLPSVNLTGWNRSAPKFIDAPEFTWEPVPRASLYRVDWSAAGPAGRTESRKASFDFGADWPRLGTGDVSWSVTALDAAGKILAESGEHKFFKAPDFDLSPQAPLDWLSAARKNLNFLLDLPLDSKNDYPRYLTYSWHDTDPEGLALAYPALHFPSFVFLFLEALKSEKDPVLRARIETALAQVTRAILDCRVPAGAAKGMALTIMVTRDPQGNDRSDRLTLFRTARMGQALLALHDRRPSPELLDYARQIAQFLMRYQESGGALPFRLDPHSGEVISSYTSATISTLAFFESLNLKEARAGYQDYAAKALAWTLKQPCQTMRWEGMYEDVEAAPAFSNLENWDTLDAILHLAGPGRGLPGGLDMARSLNRFVEDQFVVFGAVPGATWSQVSGPLVMERSCCYYPMEVHTAHWIQALEALHAATGEGQYRLKAVAAANAIVRSQYEDGRFSTWGRNKETGKSLNHEADWYGCNAYAGAVLYKLAREQQGEA